MANDRLRAEVAAELSWDPKVDGTDITVSVQGGRVTLHGTVTRLRQKREADRRRPARLRGHCHQQLPGGAHP